MIRSCFVIVFLLFSAADLRAQVVSSQTFSGDELVQRGVYRLGDIGLLFDRVRVGSVDGFASGMTVGGLSPLQHRSYRVYVDGHEVQPGFWDIQNLTSLGISTTEIDSVRLIAHPVYIGGQLAGGGALEIWTRTYDSAVAASGSAFIGNESGDPGPFRYTGNETYSNVDKIGPDASTNLTIQNADVLFAAGTQLSQVIPSDEAVFRRNRKIFNVDTTPEVTMISPYVRFFWKGKRMTSDARVFGSTDEDMLFSRAIAREIPVDMKQFQVSWLGTVNSSSVGDVMMRTSYRLVDARNLATATRIPLDWNESALQTSVSLRPVNTEYISEVGLNAKVVRASSAYESQPIANQSAASLYFSMSKTHGGTTINSNTGIGVYNSRFTGNIVASVQRPVRNSVAGVNVALMRLHRQEADPVGAWLAEGLEASRDIPTTSTSGETYGLYSADASWSWRHDATGIGVEVVPSLRYFDDADLLARTIVADGVGFVVESNGSQRSDGTLAGTAITFSHTADVTSSRFVIDVQGVIQGDRYFRNAFNEVPTTRIGFQTAVTPAPSFSAFFATTYLTESIWSDYALLDTMDDESPYSSRVDDAFKIDAGLSKGLWTERVKISVLLENILNDHISYHPIGARFDRTMKITAHVRLD